uniref:Pr6Pr family membrane protein n=1 Tax=Escherichia coli TaxID=562 RepID=UPI003C2D7682
ILGLVGVVALAVHGNSNNPDFRWLNFFSYFTIEANVIGALVLLIAGFAALRGSQTRELSGLRGAAAVYLVITGIVYNLLLRDLENPTTDLPWANFIVHVIMPIVILLDFLLDRTVHRLGLRNALWWVGFPLVWTAYTLIRGQIADWYPYPFLDAGAKGWG